MSAAVRRLPVLLAALLVACGGVEYGGEVATTNPPPGGGGDGVADCEALFAQRVQPRLAFCRSCHVSGGLADVEDGRDFMLSTDPAADAANFRASWQRLGARILDMASGEDARSHSGGAPWPPGSEAYRDVARLLQGYSDPAACVIEGSGPGEEWPLLGSRRGGHYWFDFCEGKPDDAVVPPDPRELVVPGVNRLEDGASKAVYMNAFWQTCQTDDKYPEPHRRNHPGTCGELRARVARGYPLIAAAGQVGAGTFFSGNSHDTSLAFSASLYNTMWREIWGLSARPDNFDRLVAERWGMPLSPTRNPYPLPGEDPNAPGKDGGSGQLPMGLTQLRRPDGSWTGRINVTCSICHGGQVGEPADGPGLGAMYGTNSLSDITVMFTDLGRLAPQQGSLAVVTQNKVRGTGNITNFQLFGTLTITETETLPGYLSIQAEPSTGTEDPPVWWNAGHRSMKFYDGGQTWDSKRIELSFHFPNTPNHGAPGPSTMDRDKAWILDHQQDGDAWILSLRSPEWPAAKLGAIDVALAERGAILFHSKNLWEPAYGNPVPQPDGGNGSCASCHGAYSPRYVNDPAFLDTPLLEGIAAYIVPLEVIGTDSRRVDGNSQRVAEAARTNWFAYRDGPYHESGVSLCADWNDTALRGERRLGYLAPPLYGVWATAPYFHNGAVPTLAQVLDPAARPTIWRRPSSAPRPDQAGKVVMGFDASLAAYDAGQVGWRHESLACGTGSMPFVDCNPVDDDGATVQDALAQVWGHGGLAWNLLNPPVMSNQQIEERKVYNTKYYSQSNAGHEFTSVLTADERKAILEYLKTL